MYEYVQCKIALQRSEYMINKIKLFVCSHEAEQAINFEHSRKISFFCKLFVIKIFNSLSYLGE